MASNASNATTASAASSSLAGWDCRAFSSVDPQGAEAQAVGYAKVALVVAHAVPSMVKIWRKQDASVVPSWSLAFRTVLGALSAVFGVLICQLPEVVGGLGSLAVFAVIIAAKIKFRHCHPPAPHSGGSSNPVAAV
jgi:hypothetical protein